MTICIQLEYYQKLVKESPEQIKAQALLFSYVYSFKTRQAPFEDFRVRQALSMAVFEALNSVKRQAEAK